MKTLMFWFVLALAAPLAACVPPNGPAQYEHPESSIELTQAAGTGDIAEVDRLLTAGAPLQEPYAMQAAVLSRQYQMARHLISRGAPINGTGVIQSPLWYAVAHGDTEMAALLLNLGADVDWQTDQMGTPLHAALDSYGAKDNRLALAKLLLEHKADVNALQRDNALRENCLATPLHAAVFSLEKNLVDFLLAQGADPRLTDRSGKTPAQCARERLKTVRVQDLKLKIEEIVSLLESKRL